MLDKSYDGIIFDLDGTMWDTRKPICEAWNIILSRHEEIHRAPIVEADLNDCMGLPMYDIAAKLFPQEQEQVRDFIMLPGIILRRQECATPTAIYIIRQIMLIMNLSILSRH